MAQGARGFTNPENWSATFYLFEPLKLRWLPAGLTTMPEMVGQWANH